MSSEEAAATTLHHYPSSAVYADYLRAGGGLAVTLGPLVLLDVAPVVGFVLGVLALLFGWFAVRTWRRQMSTLTVSERGLEVQGPNPRRLAWDELDEFRLAYFAPRGNRERGWFELTLKGARAATLRIDSSLDGFDRLLARTLAAARVRGVPLDAATLANLEALGLASGGGRADEGPGSKLI